jgi:hypothetical protein
MPLALITLRMVFVCAWTIDDTGSLSCQSLHELQLEGGNGLVESRLLSMEWNESFQKTIARDSLISKLNN